VGENIVAENKFGQLDYVNELYLKFSEGEEEIVA